MWQTRGTSTKSEHISGRMELRIFIPFFSRYTSELYKNQQKIVQFRHTYGPEKIMTVNMIIITVQYQNPTLMLKYHLYLNVSIATDQLI